MTDKDFLNILGFNGKLDKNTIEYDIIMNMKDESDWVDEMKKEHNFYELCRQLELAGFERFCPTCFYNQLRLGKKEHGIL